MTAPLLGRPRCAQKYKYTHKVLYANLCANENVPSRAKCRAHLVGRGVTLTLNRLVAADAHENSTFTTAFPKEKGERFDYRQSRISIIASRGAWGLPFSHGPR